MSVLAINGGTKACQKDLSTKWPVYDETEAEGLFRVSKRSLQGKGGSETANFEKIFADYNQVKHCIVCANGTVSIELILRGLGLTRGDEVIIPPYTFIATVSSIIYAGLTPVFADVEPDTGLLSAEGVRKKITPKTKAIIPVYVGGRPADLDALQALANEYGLYLIGDAAQAAGSEWRGKPIGSYGIAASFSCQNSKNLTCGEGGLITTNDDQLAKNIRLILNGGLSENGQYTNIGLNHNVSEWQSALLIAQHKRLDEQIAKRMENAAYLDSLLSTIPCMAPLASDERITKNSLHLYVTRIREDQLGGVSRSRFIEALQAEGLEVLDGYFPLYDFRCLFANYPKHNIGTVIDENPNTPNAEQFSRHEAMWLLQSVFLNEKSDMEIIYNAVKKVYDNLNEL